MSSTTSTQTDRHIAELQLHEQCQRLGGYKCSECSWRGVSLGRWQSGGRPRQSQMGLKQTGSGNIVSSLPGVPLLELPEETGAEKQ